MPTRPTADQLRFNSAANGEQVLDAYMEDVEKGGRTLGDLLTDLFNVSGELTNFITFREDPGSPGDLQYQFAGGPWITFTYTPYAASYASEWADADEDVLISAAAGGNQTDDYSAKHWAIKSAASADSFDDRYLGPFTTNPTLDNDGDPLQDGAVYFNTNDNTLRFYDLAETTWFVFGGAAIPIYEDPQNNLVGGSTAGINLIVGANDNTIYGMGAANKITDGDGNVIIGRNAGPTTNQSNKLYIGNSETDTPLIYGDFATNEVTINGTLFVDTADINNLIVDGIGASALFETTIQAGEVAGANGAVFLQNRLVAGDYLNVFGSLYSTQESLIAYGVRPRTGVSGYESTADGAAYERAALEVGGSTPFKLLYAGLSTTPIGTTIAMTELASIDSTGFMTLADGLLVQGAFTSIGFDDNATEEVFQLSDTGMRIGSTDAVMSMYHQVNDQIVYIAGGSSIAQGAQIRLDGGGYSSGGDMFFRANNITYFHHDQSIGNITWTMGGTAGTYRVDADSGRFTFNSAGDFVIQNTGGGDILQLVDAGAPNQLGASVYMEFNWTTTIGGSLTRLGYLGYSSITNEELIFQNDSAVGGIRFRTNGAANHLLLNPDQTSTFYGTVDINGNLTLQNSNTSLYLDDTSGSTAGTDRLQINIDNDLFAIKSRNASTNALNESVWVGTNVAGSLTQQDFYTGGAVRLTLTDTATTLAGNLNVTATGSLITSYGGLAVTNPGGTMEYFSASIVRQGADGTGNLQAYDGTGTNLHTCLTWGNGSGDEPSVTLYYDGVAALTTGISQEVIFRPTSGNVKPVLMYTGGGFVPTWDFRGTGIKGFHFSDDGVEGGSIEYFTDGIGLVSKDGNQNIKVLNSGVTINGNNAAIPDEVTGYTRARNIQMQDEPDELEVYALLGYDVTETFGPTNSGALNIWSALDDMPPEATHVILSGRVDITSNGNGGASGNMQAHPTAITTPAIIANHRLADVTEPNPNSTEFGVPGHPRMIPLDANKTFKVHTSHSLTSTSSMTADLFYWGFVTD